MAWLYQRPWLEPFGTSSKRNAVCVGGSRGVAAKSGNAALATIHEKRVKKKRKILSRVNVCQTLTMTA